MKFTIVKKIEGDIRGFKADLKSALRLEDKQIRINHVTGHLEISVRMDGALRGSDECNANHGE
jgi:hypothetical protein